MSESYEERLREFHLELELLVATHLMNVPITAIKKYYGSSDMAQIVSKILAPVVRHARR